MKKSILLLTICWLWAIQAFSQEEFRPFITTWNVPSEGLFVIPLSNNRTYNFEFYVIEETDTVFSGEHTNADEDFIFGSIDATTVELHIYGQFPHFANYTKELLLDVNQWGDIVWESMAESFRNWPGVTFSATDTPDLSNVTSMNRMFQDANVFNADISTWDVSNVKNFGVLFFHAHNFNQDISAWDVSSATNMISMFRETKTFNQDLGTWDVDSVTNMGEMFMDAKAFNKDISTWDIRSVTNFNKFMDNATKFSGPNYDKLLTAWAALANEAGVTENISLTANRQNYCFGEAGREILTNNFGWNFNDAGKECSSANDIVSFAPNPFLSLVDAGIDATKHLVQVYLPAGGDFSNITPQIEVSKNAIVSPESGETVDLSSPVTYTVTAFDGTEQEWTVEVLCRPFITTWEVTSGGETITIPTPITDFDFQYRWIKEDVVVEDGFHTGGARDFTTTFAEAGTYQLEILGYFVHFAGYPKEKLLDVVQWGDIVWRNMQSSFEDWPGEGFSATDAPDLSNVSNMRNMFFRASNFNSPLNNWDVSNIRFMRNLFSSASSFNQDLDNWNVSRVSDFESVFRNASVFNGNISNWEVNEATTMFLMFAGAENFNQDISDWQTGKVRDMREVFASASAFNQDVSQWDVQSVENMRGMFSLAISFDQDLSNWEISSVNDMSLMFNSSGLSSQNYDKTLIGWATQEVQSSVTLGAEGITFCKGEAARQSLIADHNWEITDDGKVCSSETVITFFDSNLENGLGIIKASENIISLAVTEGTDVSAIVPTINLSPGATISPAPGTPVDLNNVVYTVTAEDGITTQDWTFEFTGPRFITTWIVEGDEGLEIEGSEEGFVYDYDVVVIDDNNTIISSGRANAFDGLLPLEAGEYRVEISGEFPHFVGFPGDQLIDVLQWGDIQWKSMKFSFQGWEGTGFSATDAPDLSLVTDMTGMFENAFNFNGNLSNWNVSAIEDMHFMFYNANAFNGDLSEWNVSSVTDMQEMFATDTGEPMAFNSDISSWNVGKVVNMAFMFNEASSFDRDLSGWDVSSLEAGAGTGADGMFEGSGLSPQNYDNLLIGWSERDVQDNVHLGAPEVTFCKGAGARQTLIDDHNWIINDAGSVCSSETDILSFVIEGQVGVTTIDTDNHTVTLTMPFVTDLSTLVPDFELSVGAESTPATGQVVDLSTPVIYTITAEDGTTQQDWTVTVVKAANTATDIEEVVVEVNTEEISIDVENHTVEIIFSHGTDISAVPVIFTLSEGATSSVGEQATFDFSVTQSIIITAEDGTTVQDWTLSGTFAPNTATDIETLTVNANTEEIAIDTENHTVTILFPANIDLSAVEVDFTLSTGATSNLASGTLFDLTNELVITVTAEDGITQQDWTIIADVEEVLSVGKEQINWRFYPNPVNSVLFVESSSAISITLLTSTGQVVSTEKTGRNHKLDLKGLEAGFYILLVQHGNTTITEKILKQ